MEKFCVEQIGKHTYGIQSDAGASFYIVEGEQYAAVIDTGILPGEKIRPIIENLTEKKLILILTHAHGDHVYHMDEFETVYMCHEDLKMSPEMLSGMVGGKDLKLEETLDIHMDDSIDLGGEQLEICQVPGHTPGSVAILAKQQNFLFTGDAIGSGCGVWMQLPGCMSLEKYYDGLIRFMKWLVERGGRMKFFGGHHRQQYQSEWVSQFNPLNMGLLADMIDLVDKILRGEIIGKEKDFAGISLQEPVRYACFGRAEIYYLSSRIR